MKKKRSSISVWLMSLILLIPLTLSAKTVEFIKVGLESVYKESTSIKLTGEENIALGYTIDGEFEALGYLNNQSVQVTPQTKTLYAYDQSYSTYIQAEGAAKAYQDAVVAYIEPNVFRVYTTNKEKDVSSISSAQILEVYNTVGQLILISDAKSLPLAFQGISNTYPKGSTGVGESRKYRGAIEIVKGQTKGLTPVNVVDIESYLYGVVPAEVVPSWPIEALKAQAVASRSIAIYQYNKYASKGYNVTDTTAVQVYKGITIETTATTKAVNETQGEVATFKDEIAETLYYSTSGGYTEDPLYVWGNTVAYLKAVPDIYETSPEQGPWDRTITLKEVDKCLANAGISIGGAQGIRIVSRTTSGRVQELEIIGTTGVHKLTNERIRSFFGATAEGSLKSRMFKFIPYDDISNTQQTASASGVVVNIMSEKDFGAQPLSQLYVMSVSGFGKLPQTVWLQTASGKTSLEDTVTKNTNYTEIKNTNEVIYGDFTLYGKGVGHGVGMSQSGAKGMALAGYTYDQILEYYFPGIKLQ